jgi:hypothetical protein
LELIIFTQGGKEGREARWLSTEECR